MAELVDRLTNAGASGPPVDERRWNIVAQAISFWKRQPIDLTGNNRLLYFRIGRYSTLDITPGSSLQPDELTIDRLLGGAEIQLSSIGPAWVVTRACATTVYPGTEGSLPRGSSISVTPVGTVFRPWPNRASARTMGP